jgi:hypothetical protein
MRPAGRRGKRLLYWFRTPPGVRVGRAPIDETAIRLLEQHNPDIQFDWTRILKAPPPAEGQGRRDPRESRDRDQRGRRESRPSPRPRSGGAPPAAPSPARESWATEPPPQKVEYPAADIEAVQLDAPAVETQKSPETPQDPLPAEEVEFVSGGGIEAQEIYDVRPEDAVSAAGVRLGAEGLVRLRARYAEVMARIAEHTLDEPAREELKQRAERLNPDAWVTADEVTAALEQYETVFEGLRGIVGRHPQRRRRGRKQV